MKNIEKLTSPTRERTSVPISGLDLSTPDDLVQDGKCETLHNMRYEAEAWRPVNQHVGKVVSLSKTENLPATEGESTPTTLTFTILYKHPIDNKDVYIARRQIVQDGNSEYIICRFDTSKEEYTDIATLSELPKISHFGNILILSTDNSINYYIYKDNRYNPFSMPECAKTLRVDYENSYEKIPATLGKEFATNKWITPHSGSSYTQLWFRIINKTTGTKYNYLSNYPEYWNGEMMLFTTFVMEDGTLLSPSPLHLITSYRYAQYEIPPSEYLSDYNFELDFNSSVPDETTTDKYVSLKLSKSGGMPYDQSVSFLHCAKPEIEVFIPKDFDTSFIKHIAVWCTRVHSVFKDSSISNESFTNILDMYADNDLANQPFYLLSEIDINKMEEKVYSDKKTYKYTSVILSREVMDSVVNNKVYKPNNNIHTLIPSVAYDYNRALHIADIKTIPFIGYNPYTLSYNTPNTTYYKAISLKIGEQTVVRKSSYKEYNSNLKSGSAFTKVLSYPDYRANKLVVSFLFDVELKEAIANNFSWYHAPHTEYEKFPNITTDKNISIPDDDFPEYFINNNILVSANNNLLSYPFDRTYSVGSSSNRILAMQSSAIKIADEQMGALPLYVFTEEGIYALRAGESTLYSAINPINYDRIINPNTLAINGAIVYITEKGVHILSDKGSQVVSTPIHDSANRPPLEFLRTCQLIYPKEHNEFILLNNDYTGDDMKGKAYVFNLDARYWSTRDLSGTKLNTDELVDNTNGKIYDLNDEDENKALPIDIATRPIKLGNVEFKRLESIIPRFATNDHATSFKMDITGSVDGTKYMQMRSVDVELDPKRVNPLTLRRTPFSAKYFKFGFTFEPENGNTFNPTFTHIDLEWYAKLRHRMR